MKPIERFFIFVALSSVILTFTVTDAIAATNVAPTISGTPFTVITAKQAFTFAPTASDANNDPLTFSIVNKPSWATFSKYSGKLTGTPTYAATYSGIIISVSDGKASTSLPSFNISVINGNAPPVITGTPATSVTIPNHYTFTPRARDANHDTLTFSIANKPAWAFFNTLTGNLNGTPNSAAIGTYRNIIISVSDGKTSVALPAFNIVVSGAASSSSSSSSVSSSRSSSSSSTSNSSSSSSSSSRSSSSSSQSSSGALSIHVDGKDFKDGAGKIVQLRGVNLMGMEYTAMAGYSPADPFPQLV